MNNSKNARAAGSGAVVSAVLLMLSNLWVAGNAQAGNVARSGNQLTLDGLPYRPVGFNQYHLPNITSGYICDSSYGAYSDATLGTLLDQMRAAGGTVIRTWFFQSYYQGASVPPVSNPWAPFDRVLNAAAARGMKVIPVLVNNWSDCEPSGGADKTIEFYRAGSAQADYQDPNSFGYPLSYRDYAQTVAAHYANNQTVAWWQLVNEAATKAADGTCPADDASVLRAFADDMTAVVKAADPNHLVSLGTIGSGQCGASSSEYQYVHEGAVDLCEVHDYNSPAVAMPGDQWNGLQARIDQCNSPTVNKPLFIGEAGISANVQPDGTHSGSITATTLYQRAQFFDAKAQAQLAAGVDGYLIWDKIPEASDSAYNAGRSTAYGVGPSSLTTDQTESVTRGASGLYGNIRSDWEDGTTGGWAMISGWGTEDLSLANSTSQSYTRLKSLSLTLSGAIGNSAAALGTGLADLTPGKTVTYRVYKPSGSTVTVKLLTRDVNWANYFSTTQTLVTGWNTLTFTVPSQPTPLKGVGLEVQNGSGWAGSIYLDSVSWPADAAPPPSVSLSVSPASFSEESPGNTATLTATLTGGTSSSPVTVNLSYSGVAVNGTDYSGAAVITVPALATSASITLTGLADTIDEGTGEGLTAAISSVSANATIGTPSSVAATVTDNDAAPSVSLSVSPASFNEESPGNTATLTATLNGSTTTTAVTINLSYSGVAVNGTDYSGAAVIPVPALATSASITLSALADTIPEGTGEGLTAAISSVSANATIGAPSSAAATILDNDAGGSQTLVLQDGLNGYAGTQDTYVASGKANTNYGTNVALKSDGNDGASGRLVSLLKWSVSQVPAGSTVSAASVTLQVADVSAGAYNLYAMNLAWTEGGAKWSNTNPPSNQGALVGTLTPTSLGTWVVQLNAAGVSLVQGWVSGSAANNGIMVIDAGTSDGVDFRSSEYGTAAQRPSLSITYQ